MAAFFRKLFQHTKKSKSIAKVVEKEDINLDELSLEDFYNVSGKFAKEKLSPNQHLRLVFAFLTKQKTTLLYHFFDEINYKITIEEYLRYYPQDEELLLESEKNIKTPLFMKLILCLPGKRIMDNLEIFQFFYINMEKDCQRKKINEIFSEFSNQYQQLTASYSSAEEITRLKNEFNKSFSPLLTLLLEEGANHHSNGFCKTVKNWTTKQKNIKFYLEYENCILSDDLRCIVYSYLPWFHALEYDYVINGMLQMIQLLKADNIRLRNLWFL